MVEADGRVRVTCEYCSRVYQLDSAEIDLAPGTLASADA